MKDKLTYLFWQYLQNTSTQDELEEFLSYVKQAENDQSLRELIRDVYDGIHEADPSINSYIDGNGSLVFKTPDHDLPDAYRSRIQKRKSKWVLPALSVLLLLTLAGLFWRKGQSTAAERRAPMAVQS